MINTGDQTNAGGDQSYRIAITPTWEAIAKISIEALLNGTGEGQRMAREELIDLGIKLDDAKEIIEGTDTETYKKQLNRINNQVRHIEQLKNKVAGQEQGYANYQRQADKDLKTIQMLENQIAKKNGEIATLRDQLINLGDDPDTSIDEQVANNQPHREGDE